MTKKIMLATTLTTALLVSGCTLPFLNQAETTPTPAPDSATSEETAARQIMAAMENGESLHCTASNQDQTAIYDYYLQGKRFRLDGTVTTETTQVYHAISDSEYLYSWSESQDKGFKMRVPTEEEIAEQQDKYQDYMKNTPNFSSEEAIAQYEDEGYNFNCTPTPVDESRFVPDASVEFQDFTSMMDSSMTDSAMEAMPSLTPEQQEQLNEVMKKMGQ